MSRREKAQMALMHDQEVHPVNGCPQERQYSPLVVFNEG